MRTVALNTDLVVGVADRRCSCCELQEWRRERGMDIIPAFAKPRTWFIFYEVWPTRAEWVCLFCDFAPHYFISIRRFHFVRDVCCRVANFPILTQLTSRLVVVFSLPLEQINRFLSEESEVKGAALRKLFPVFYIRCQVNKSLLGISLLARLTP